ncbi:MAG: septum formation initiator family protein [Deltaproteobacteria bacterium]|jgi:cell division protein FtsB|nr:septum formation initiator family protein [Deltaproteobacteria bacterium]
MIEKFSTWAKIFRDWLQSPLSVLMIVGTISFGAVLVDGTLFRLWSLARDRDQLMDRLVSLKKSIADKEKRFAESHRPEFIERQARENLDFVRDGDLVFIFSNSDADLGAVANGSLPQNAAR